MPNSCAHKRSRHNLAKGLNHTRVKLSAGATLQQLGCGFMSQRLLLVSGVCKQIEFLCNSQNPCNEWNLIADETERSATAVKVLVVITHVIGNFLQLVNRRDKLRGARCVLFRHKYAGGIDRDRTSHSAEVVQKRCSSHV